MQPIRFKEKDNSYMNKYLILLAIALFVDIVVDGWIWPIFISSLIWFIFIIITYKQ